MAAYMRSPVLRMGNPRIRTHACMRACVQAVVEHCMVAMDFDYHCEQVACTHARALTHSRAHAYVTHKRAGGGAVPRQVLAAGPA